MNFSVVIPLYNKQAYVLRAMRSVLAQTHAEFELIVIDDGSTDASASLVESVQDPRIRLVRQPNRGESGARNTGINEARYPYIVFLDADDAWKPHHLQVIADLIADFPNAGLYCTGYFLLEPPGKIKMPKWFRVPLRGYVDRYFLSVSKGDLIATSSSVCIPSTVFSDLGGFSIGDRLGADQDMWARIALKYRIAVDSVLTTTYFRDADNRICVSEKHEAELPYSSRLQTYLDKNRLPAEISGDIEAYIKAGLLTLVSVNVRNSRQDQARKLLSDSRLRGTDFRTLIWILLAHLPSWLTTGALRTVDRLRLLRDKREPG